MVSYMDSDIIQLLLNSWLEYHYRSKYRTHFFFNVDTPLGSVNYASESDNNLVSSY